MAHWKLKIEKQFADEIVSGMKNFEIRCEHDKVFQRGDSVEFIVYPPELRATGPGTFHVPAEDHPIDGRIYDITYVLHGWGLREDYCAFAIKERVNEETAVNVAMAQIAVKSTVPNIVRKLVNLAEIPSITEKTNKE